VKAQRLADAPQNEQNGVENTEPASRSVGGGGGGGGGVRGGLTRRSKTPEGHSAVSI
jgi:hypothetical protein